MPSVLALDSGGLDLRSLSLSGAAFQPTQLTSCVCVCFRNDCCFLCILYYYDDDNAMRYYSDGCVGGPGRPKQARREQQADASSLTCLASMLGILLHGCGATGRRRPSSFCFPDLFALYLILSLPGTFFRSLLSVCRADDLLRTQAFQRLRSSWLQNLPRRACLPTPSPLSPLSSSSTFSSSDIRMPPGSPPPLPSALSSSLSF
jgi:hypothetical protein